MTIQAVDSVDSHKKRACPHYPQPYDDGADPPPSCGWGLLAHFQTRITINTASSGTTFWGNFPGTLVRIRVVQPRLGVVVVVQCARFVGVDVPGNDADHFRHQACIRHRVVQVAGLSEIDVRVGISADTVNYTSPRPSPDSARTLGRQVECPQNPLDCCGIAWP